MRHAAYYPASITELEVDIESIDIEIGEQRAFIATHPHSDRSSVMRRIACLEEDRQLLEDLRYSIA